MALTPATILAALERIKGPDLTGNIVDLGLVSDIAIRDGTVSFSITVPADRGGELEPLRQAAESVVAKLPGVSKALVVLTADRSGASARTDSPRVAAARAGQGGHAHAHPHAPASAAARGGAVGSIKHLVAVASGKGGVGKSTTAVNLALGFAALGLKAGVLDADVYGPSQPKLLGLTGRPKLEPGSSRLQPMRAYGLEVMSMGFLVDEATPVIWRGPMVVGALNQMLREVAWGPLDVLVIDMPPGTGDVQLTMAQQVPLSGAIIVSTPQDLALIDARKGLNMFKKVDVPVLGIVENMSFFVCPKCGERSDVFGHGGAEDEARKLGLPFLGAVPLHMDIRAKSDLGTPIVATAPESIHSAIYRDIAARAWQSVSKSEGVGQPPALEISPDKAALRVAFEQGSVHELPAEMLRVMSPSAEVQGHSPSQRVTLGGKKNVKIKELRPVGNYAVRIVFDDGHDSGLYSWSYLDELGRDREAKWATYLAELKAKGLSR